MKKTCDKLFFFVDVNLNFKSNICLKVSLKCVQLSQLFLSMSTSIGMFVLPERLESLKVRAFAAFVEDGSSVATAEGFEPRSSEEECSRTRSALGRVSDDICWEKQTLFKSYFL